VHTLAYNRRLQASAIKLLQNSSATTPLQQFDYGYGEFNTTSGGVDTSKNNGQIGKITGTIGGTTQWLQGFQYDELGRLKNVAEYQSGSMSSQTYSQGYTYDRYGNRFQSANSTLGLPSVSSSDYDTTNNNNRFVSSVATYDPAGNILSDAKFRGMNYSYDANGRMTSASRTDNTDGQTSVYDCAGQRVQTSANNVTRTMVYDIFGQLVADYLGSSGSTLERENIYRGGQLLAVYETGASCYKSISQFVSDFYQGALGRAYNSASDPAWVAILTQAQAQGQGQLIAAAQSLGNSVFGSSEFTNHLPDTAANRGAFVTALYAAYLGRGPDGYGYDAWVAALNNGSSRDEVRHGFAYSAEFQNDVGQLCVTTSSTGASLKYVLSDLQGTTRAVMNNSGSSSAVVARHDYLPFGEELWAGIGSRSSSTQAYGATDGNRQKYGLTERDDATGLDHTWWRKYESFSGRWTSPDSIGGDLGDPQSFNAYPYGANDPANLVDPDGLDPISSARNLLRSGSCRGLFGKTNPIALLDRLIMQNHLRVSDQSPRISKFIGQRFVGFSNFRPFGTAGMQTIDVSLHPSVSGPERNPYIFMSSAYVAGLASGTLYGGEFQGLSSEEVAGVSLIHELLHAAGRIPHDGGGSIQADAQSHLNNWLVKEFCVTIPNKPLSTPTALPQNFPTMRPPIGGGGYGGGIGGDPWQWYAMADFLNWLDSLSVRGGDPYFKWDNEGGPRPGPKHPPILH